MLAGKPFLWDAYRESNGAHREKSRDLAAFVDGSVAWGNRLVEFLEPPLRSEAFAALLEKPPTGFEALAERLAGHDLVRTAEAEIRRFHDLW